MSETQLKDRDGAPVDYGIDWSDWLGTDTIATSTWTVSPAGLTIVTNDKTTQATSVQVSGGVRGIVYRLANRIVSVTGGLGPERGITVRVGDQ